MKYYIIICFSFFVSYGQSFQTPTDSLKTILKTKKLSYQERVEILYKLAFEGSKSLSSSYNREIYNISKNNNYLKGLGYYYHIEARSSLYYNDFVKAEILAKKSGNYFKIIGDFNNYISTIVTTCRILEALGKTSVARQLAYKIIKLYNNKPNCDNIADLYSNIAYGDEIENKQSSKIKFYYVNKALVIYIKNKNDLGILNCYVQIIRDNLLNGLYDNVKKISNY